MDEAPGTGRVRCADWTQSACIDPIGSAPRTRGFLLIEWPTPWPRDIGDEPVLAEVSSAAATSGVRVQAVAPRSANPSTFAVVLYSRPADDQWFSGFERAAVVGTLSELPLLAKDLLDRATALLGSRIRDPSDHDLARDVLICTHGRRDVCCGAGGTRLHAVVGQHLAPHDRMRVWRSSHLGGHRFAPTATFLPDGTSWAFLDLDAVRRIAARRGPIRDLLPRYRGCAGLATAAGQILERHAFAALGWRLLGLPRRDEVCDNGVELRVAVGTAELLWRARIIEGPASPKPRCGASGIAGSDYEPTIELADVERPAS